jgi:hypothetical protein
LQLNNTDNIDLKKKAVENAAQESAARNWATNQREETRIAFVAKVLAVAEGRSWAHAPPELLRAA